MARIKLEVDRNAFQRVVSALEEKQTFSNQSALWKAVEQTDWAKGLSPRPMTAAVAYQRSKELRIVVKTLPGKRGFATMTACGTAIHGGLQHTPEHRAALGSRKRRPRAEKMRAFSDSFEGMRKTTPARFHPLVAQAEKGSLRAALKLKCLDCTCWTPVEIKFCACKDCPLFPHRPYQERQPKQEEAA